MDIKRNNHKYTAKYAAIQGSYWPIFCSSYSFASVFLLSRNFNNSEIGIVLAIANVFAVFLQPAIASFADKTKKISLKNLTAALAFIACVMTIVRCFIPNVLTVLAVLLTLELTLLFSLQPLINALGMRLINKGVGINFGLARGLGSVAFAVCSYIVGVLVERFGPEASPVVSVCFFISLIFFVYTFTKEKKDSAATEEVKYDCDDTNGERGELSGEPATANIIEFALKYKKFVLLLLAVALTFCSHSMINNYFIQVTEHVGGNTKDMGFAIGVAAVVELPAMVLFTYLVRKIRCSTIMKTAFIVFVMKAVITFLAPNVMMINVSQLLQFGAYALFIPASVFYVNQTIARQDLVKGQAFVTGAITMGGVLASLLGGWLLDGPGVSAMLFAGIIMTLFGMLFCFLAVEKTPLEREKVNIT